MSTIADQSFFVGDTSGFHNFPADDQELVRIFIRSIRTSVLVHWLTRIAAVAALMACGYFIYGIAKHHEVEAVIIGIIGILLFIFNDSLRESIAERYNKFLMFLFAEFTESVAYKNAEAGIVAILQRNGFTYVPMVQLNTPIGTGYYPAGIFPYDRETKKPIHPMGDMVVDKM